MTTIEGFDTGDFTAYPWEHGGSGPWVIVADIAHQGAFSARSGKVEHNDSSTLQITMQLDHGWISFWTKIASQDVTFYPYEKDTMVFNIDGNMAGRTYGESDWRQSSYFVSRGTHTFTWTYTKDSWQTEGQDVVWIDDIEFPIP